MIHPFKIIRSTLADKRMLGVAITAGATYLGRFAQTITLFVILPIAKNQLSPELFGVWMLLTGLLSFSAFADFGVGNGVLNGTTKAIANGDKGELRKVIVSGYIVTAAAAVLILIFWLIWQILDGKPSRFVGEISDQNFREVTSALTMFVIILAVNIPASLVLRIQLGAQQGYFNGLNQLVASVFTIVAVIICFRSGGGLPGLIFATIGVQCVTNIVNSFAWNILNAVFSSNRNFKLVDAKKIRSLVKTGFFFFFLQLSVAFAFQSDSIVISQILGAEAYGSFAIVQRLFIIVSLIISTAMVGFWPAFGDAIAGGNLAWVKTALRNGLILSFSLALVGTVFISLALPFITKLWLGHEVPASKVLLLFLSIWVVIESMANVVGALLNSASILRAQLFLAVSMATLAFGGKWLLVPILGPAGSVLATIVAYCLVSVPGQIYILSKTFKEGFKNA